MYQPLSDGTLHLLAIDLPLACVLVTPYYWRQTLCKRQQPCPYCSGGDADGRGCVLALCCVARDSTRNRSSPDRPGRSGGTGTSAQFGYSCGEFFCDGRIAVCDCAVRLAGICRQNATEGDVRDLRCFQSRLRALFCVANHRGTPGRKIGGSSGGARATLITVDSTVVHGRPDLSAKLRKGRIESEAQAVVGTADRLGIHPPGACRPVSANPARPIVSAHRPGDSVERIRLGPQPAREVTQPLSEDSGALAPGLREGTKLDEPDLYGFVISRHARAASKSLPVSNHRPRARTDASILHADD